VSKKSKKRGRRVGLCLGCGAALRKRDKRCKECGRASRLFQGKSARVAAPAFLAKSAGSNVVPIARARAARVCWNGHGPGKRSARCCTKCGEPYALTYAEHSDRIAKAADPLGSTYWGQFARREPDPAQREVYRELARKEAIGQAGSEAAFVAKSLGYRSLADAIARETDPATARWLRQAEAGHYRNGGASA
jgi:predicted amidophosphoribosyltransferase